MLKPWRKGHCYLTANSQTSKNISLLAYPNSKYVFSSAQNSFDFFFFFLSWSRRSLYKRQFSFMKLHITCTRSLIFVAWLMSVNVREVCVFVCADVCSNISKSINRDFSSSSSSPQLKLLSLAWCSEPPYPPQSIWFCPPLLLVGDKHKLKSPKALKVGINNISPRLRGEWKKDASL